MGKSSTEWVKADTLHWLEQAVIGLNLCPFAKAPHVKGRIHYAVSTAIDTQDLRQELLEELTALRKVDPQIRETTLLIVPHLLSDFLDFNDFLALADRVLRSMKLVGVIQIASFHPRYQFAGTLPDDIGNCTNRAPYPTLHLLREDSVDRAVQAFPEADAIFEVNLQTMQDLGAHGWQALNIGPHDGKLHDKT